MRKTKRIGFGQSIAILLLPILLIACGDAAEESAEETTATEETTDAAESVETSEETAEPARPTVENGVQVITVTVEDTGYTPNRIAFTAGMPAKIIFDQHGTTACAWDVMSNDLDIALTELPEGTKTEVAFTPAKSGSYTFSCGMDMLKGTIVVEEKGA